MADNVNQLFLSPNLMILDATDGYLEATMTTRDGIVGKHLFEVFPDPPNLGATGVSNLSASLNRVRDNLVPDEMPVQRYDIRNPHGRWEMRYWLPINTPELDADGRLERIVHEVKDVTNAQLKQQKKRLDRTYLFRNAFVILIALLFAISSFFFWLHPSGIEGGFPHSPPYDYLWNILYSFGSVLVLFGLFSRRIAVEAAGHILLVPGLVLNFLVSSDIFGFHRISLITTLFAIGSGMRAYGLIKGWQEGNVE